jgi:hypothetical protein
MTTALPDAPITTTGEVALPVTSGAMLRMLSELTEPPQTYSTPRDNGHPVRRESFRPRRRELWLMWSATGSLALASAALVAGVVLVR